MKQKIFVLEGELKSKNKDINDINKYIIQYDLTNKVKYGKKKENLIKEIKQKYISQESAYVLTIYKLEEEIMKGEKVTEEKIEDSLNYDLLSEAEKKAIDEFCEKIDVTDSTQVLQFGSSAQNKISEFSDSVLDSVKTKNAGEVGDLLSSLVVEVKNFDAGVPSTMNPKGLQGMFFNAKKQIQKIIAKYDDVENNIDKIEKQLETHKIKMLKDITIYDTMYEKNLDYFNEISLYIIAGEKKLKELKEVVLPELQAKAKETGEQVDAQKANDMINTINRFEKKLYDLKTTRIISIQMAPQVSL